MHGPTVLHQDSRRLPSWMDRPVRTHIAAGRMTAGAAPGPRGAPDPQRPGGHRAPLIMPADGAACPVLRFTPEMDGGPPFVLRAGGPGLLA
jgi:hypothetical protein